MTMITIVLSQIHRHQHQQFYIQKHYTHQFNQSKQFPIKMSSITTTVDVATHEKGFGQVQLNKSNQDDLLKLANQFDFSSLATELRGEFSFVL